jgi:hypothetical protein
MMEILTAIFTTLLASGATGILSAVLLLSTCALAWAYWKRTSELHEMISDLQEARLIDLKDLIGDYNSLTKDQVAAFNRLADKIK